MGGWATNDIKANIQLVEHLNHDLVQIGQNDSWLRGNDDDDDDEGEMSEGSSVVSGIF